MGVRVNIVTPGGVLTPGADEVRCPILETEQDAVDTFSSQSPTLAALLAEEADENDRRDSWMEGAAIKSYVAELAERDLFSADLESLLDNAEWLLSHNETEWMRSWLQAVFEAVQNIVSNQRSRGDRRTRAEAVCELLGDRSRVAWRALNDWWGNCVDQI